MHVLPGNGGACCTQVTSSHLVPKGAPVTHLAQCSSSSWPGQFPVEPGLCGGKWWHHRGTPDGHRMGVCGRRWPMFQQTWCISFPQIPFKPLRQAPFSPIRRMPDGLAVALAWKWGPFVVFSRGSAAPRLGPGLLEFTCIHLPLGVGDRRVTQGPRLVLSLI